MFYIVPYFIFIGLTALFLGAVPEQYFNFAEAVLLIYYIPMSIVMALVALILAVTPPEKVFKKNKKPKRSVKTLAYFGVIVSVVAVCMMVNLGWVWTPVMYFIGGMMMTHRVLVILKHHEQEKEGFRA